jgi:hypothetical protein
MTLLLFPDTFENLQFDENLEQILEEICKSLHFFLTIGLMSKNNNNIRYHYTVDEAQLVPDGDDIGLNGKLYRH